MSAGPLFLVGCRVARIQRRYLEYNNVNYFFENLVFLMEIFVCVAMRDEGGVHEDSETMYWYSHQRW